MRTGTPDPDGDLGNPRVGTDAGQSDSFRLAVELEPGAVPLSGRVVPSSGDPLDFSGYVELITAIESFRSPPLTSGPATSES